MGVELGPAGIEERLHAVAGFSDWRVVLVKRDTIDEHDLQIGHEVVPSLIPLIE